MVELAVGLVVILILFAGLIQIGRLSRARTRTMIEARERAGRNAMDEGFSGSGGSWYILGWGAGPDGKAYTADDLMFPITNAAGLIEDVESMAQADELEYLVPGNPLSGMGESTGATNVFYLVYGEGQASVPTFPVIRSLIYRRSAISTESRAWLVWTQEIY